MKKFMLRFLANRGAAAGLVLLLLVILTGVLASVFYEDSPWMMVAQPCWPPLPIRPIRWAPTCWAATSPPAWPTAPACP